MLFILEALLNLKGCLFIHFKVFYLLSLNLCFSHHEKAWRMNSSNSECFQAHLHIEIYSENKTSIIWTQNFCGYLFPFEIRATKCFHLTKLSVSFSWIKTVEGLWFLSLVLGVCVVELTVISVIQDRNIYYNGTLEQLCMIAELCFAIAKAEDTFTLKVNCWIPSNHSLFGPWWYLAYLENV